MPAAAVTDARIALLGGLIDHAPTFPPASLAPAEALAEDRRARASEQRFMLGRLVWPASRWDELGDEPRVVSVVLDADRPQDPRIESVEVRHPGSLEALDPASYVEVPAGDLDALAGIAASGARAKVRCGGATVPEPTDLGAFVRRCRELRLPFKATAGLHHAVRTDGEHGFLNLLAAAVFGDEEAALAETDAGAFGLTLDSFSWRGRAAGPDELDRTRRELLHAIGSCSFFEPVEELVALELL